MKSYKDNVDWGMVRIPYSYSFAKRKTMGISVHPDLSVTVKAPIGTTPEVIQRFVRRRGGWISRAMREFERFLPKQPPRRYISGESHRYMGKQYRLKLVQGVTESVKCLRGYLWVTTREKPSRRKAKALLDDWCRTHAKTLFQERLLACHQRLARLGIPLPLLHIRNLKNRWGSCSSKGRITLNLALIKAPKECIDYVITHELCHLKINHHTPKFWRLLQRYVPDFEDRRRRLNLFTDLTE